VSKPRPKKRDTDKSDSSGLARILRKRRPTGGIVLLAKYARMKGVAA
jgi:hypothetical protein